MLFEKYKVLLAPMAGVSDSVFRTLCKEAGADLTFCEMVSAKGLSFANKKTRNLIDIRPEETEVGVQIFGHEPDVMARQAACIEDELGEKLAYVDINMGCPARKIVSKGDGAALMTEPSLAAEIVRSVKDAVTHKVTCKFRRGWCEEEGETAPEFARRMEQAGVDAVTVHGRYAKQMYKGTSCVGTIARVKESVAIPVVGNGDIKNAESAFKMLDETGCDAIMIARAAEGNPWIFSEVKAALNGNENKYALPGPIQKIDMAKKHAKMLSEKYGSDIRIMRKHAMWYVQGMPGAAYARGRFNYCTTLEDFIAVFEMLSERVESDAARCL